jgi:hypothetical protein
VVAVLLIVAMLGVFASDAVDGYGFAQRVFLVLSSIWVLVTAVGLLRQPVVTGGAGRQPG